MRSVAARELEYAGECDNLPLLCREYVAEGWIPWRAEVALVASYVGATEQVLRGGVELCRDGWQLVTELGLVAS